MSSRISLKKRNVLVICIKYCFIIKIKPNVSNYTSVSPFSICHCGEINVQKVPLCVGIVLDHNKATHLLPCAICIFLMT